MRTVLITPATFQPLEIEEIKTRPELRITTDDDDVALGGYIRSAVKAYENFTGHVLCLSTWDLYRDCFPDEFELPAPLSSVTSITYQDTAGVWQTVDADEYVVDTTSPVCGRVVLAYGESWPTSVLEQINTVKVRFVAGYADAGSIPDLVKDGLLLKIQELYDGIDRSRVYESCWISDARLAV